MTLADEIAALLPGAQVASITPLHGGDLSDVQLVTFTDERKIVAKSGEWVTREASMLRALQAAGAKTPDILALSNKLMLLEWLSPANANVAGWTACGQSVRAIHDTVGPQYGWSEDYAFGAVHIPNAPAEEWPEFWASCRIIPSLPHLPITFQSRLTRLALALSDLLPERPPPALLHGDLWTGNIHFTGDMCALIDPASYYGHSEVDLAMLEVFGTLTPEFRKGYGFIDPSYSTRRPIYQIWPALVHVRLFGASYHAMLDRLLTETGF